MEFMPLSKRINNLHINNGLLLENATTPHPNQLDCSQWGPGPPQMYQQHTLPPTPPEPINNQNIDWNKRTATTTPQYSPELNETQNPYYFNINRLLFEMYVERMQRNGQM